MASRLWFVNNRSLEEKILAFLARYQELYQVILYAFVLMGNHYHLIAEFPQGNKAAFMRSFNAIIAKLVASDVKQFGRGKLWGRRYADQVLPRPEDIEHWFLYAALNPVTSGLCSRSADYDGYNSFTAAICGVSKTFKVFERWKYNEAKRYNTEVDPLDFVQEHTLRFSRLPGYETLSSNEYREKLTERIELRRTEVLLAQETKPRRPRNHIPSRAVMVGSVPARSKTGNRYSHRPLVLTLCPKTRKAFLDSYFALVARYRVASRAFRAGAWDTPFPPGTYRPIVLSS